MIDGIEQRETDRTDRFKEKGTSAALTCNDKVVLDYRVSAPSTRSRDKNVWHVVFGMSFTNATILRHGQKNEKIELNGESAARNRANRFVV